MLQELELRGVKLRDLMGQPVVAVADTSGNSIDYIVPPDLDDVEFPIRMTFLHTVLEDA